MIITPTFVILTIHNNCSVFNSVYMTSTINTVAFMLVICKRTITIISPLFFPKEKKVGE